MFVVVRNANVALVGGCCGLGPDMTLHTLRPGVPRVNSSAPFFSQPFSLPFLSRACVTVFLAKHQQCN
jgi:hypothetical protein